MNNNSLPILFMGSDPFSLPALEALACKELIIGVVTQPDKLQGRGLILKPGMVKIKALELGLPVYQPEKLKSPEAIAQIRELNPGLIVTAAYGQLIPKEIIELPPLGCINLHPSLLPKYRGATPVEGALMAGEEVTGNSVFFMDQGWDTGDIIIQEATPILPQETGGEIRDRLAISGAELLLRAVELIRHGEAPRISQNKNAGNYSRMLKKEDLLIDWEKPASAIHNFIRALAPHIGAETNFRGKKLKIYRSEIKELTTANHPSPGEVIELLKNLGPVVKTGDEGIILLKVKPEGKNLIPGKDFLNGYRIATGEKLD